MKPTVRTVMTAHSTSMRSALAATLVIALATTLAACGGGGGDDDKTQDITLNFAAVAGDTTIACGDTVTGLGTGSVDAQVQDLRFYISNVKLLKANGDEVALTLGANDDWNLTEGDEAVTLIDLEDGTGACAEGGTAATNAVIQGTVPADDYVGVKMTMGVPFALNHSDYATAPAPLDVQAMAWNWQYGRKHAKLEVVDPAGSASAWDSSIFYVHLGSTGCTGNPASGETVECSAPNRMDFHFHAFDPATQNIAVDLKALLAGNDLTKNESDAPGCMSGGTDPECGPIFSAMKIDWKADGSGTGLPVDEGHGQTLFKAIAK